jgi:flavin-dependent thymidylate synthase
MNYRLNSRTISALYVLAITDMRAEKMIHILESGGNEMQVFLIDFTGVGTLSPARYAAELLIYVKNTRLQQDLDTRTRIAAMSEEQLNKELAAIALTIRSSWEFIDFTWQIQDVTRAFTHQFVRGRHASYAQQSQRAVDMSGFQTSVPESIAAIDNGAMWRVTTLRIDQAYSYYREHGAPAEDARGLLPTNILTNIICKMNLRTLAETSPKRKNLRATDEYSRAITEMVDCAIGVMPWTEQFIYPERNKTPALDAALKQALAGRSPASVPELNDALKELDQLKGTWG